jgi:hypothetical protein
MRYFIILMISVYVSIITILLSQARLDHRISSSLIR